MKNHQHPQEPWEGHVEDVLWTDYGKAPLPWGIIIAFSIVMIAGVLIGTALP